MTFINFLNKKPTIKEMINIFSNEPLIQVGLLCTGKYYLMLFIMAKNNFDLNNLINRLKIDTDLRKYDSEWYITPRFVDYGTLPIRESFIEDLQNQVWKRTKDNPKPLQNQLTNREYAVIKETYLNGNADFASIDIKYGFNSGASRYIYQKLIQKEIIYNVTMSMDKAGIKYSAIFILTIINGEDFEKFRKDILEETIKDLKQINKYSYVCHINNPYGIMFIMSVYEEKELKHTEEKFLKIKGIKLDMLIVTNIFVGSFCYRKYDNAYAPQKKILVEEYGSQNTQKMVYE